MSLYDLLFRTPSERAMRAQQDDARAERLFARARAEAASGNTGRSSDTTMRGMRAAARASAGRRSLMERDIFDF